MIYPWKVRGISACIIQRPVITERNWRKIAGEFEIPGDEQIIMMIGVGMPKEQYKVPVSNRLPYNDLVKERSTAGK